MHKLYLALFFVSIFLVSAFTSQNSYAISPNVVISQVQAGAASGDLAATKEFISIYNNSDQKVDISNWCITNKVPTSFVCFTPSTDNESFLMPSYSYVTVGSDNFADQNNYQPDFIYKTVNKTSGSIVAGSDTLKLIDANGVEMDSVNWSSSLAGGYTLQRQSNSLVANHLLETDNMTDFQKINTLVIPISQLEEFIVFDACPNIIGVQDSVPDGYEINANGICIKSPVDLCKNIDGIQEILPDNNLIDSGGNCQIDVCLNIDDLQMTLPPDTIVYNDNCFAKPLPLKITELLPNALGNDDGNEFIEIYNPNDNDVSLLNYIFYLSSDYGHFYSFPADAHIEPHSYLSFTNDDVHFTLTNSDGLSLRLMSLGQIVDETPVYYKPGEGLSWALIDGKWQYTNQLTPGGPNLPLLAEPDLEVIVPGPTLAPCKDGQYRSEETHRCRNIISDVENLVPCAEGQERNPATNRCRSMTTTVLGENDLKPCDPGQERNPDTNRCRNIVSNMPQADYAPEQVAVQNDNYTSWWIISGIAVVAIGYAIWEWHSEIKILSKKLFRIK